MEYSITLITIVMMRITGMIFLNPIFGRRGIPVMLNIGLIIALTYITIGFIPLQEVAVVSTIQLAVILLKEFIVGYFMGYLIYSAVAIFLISGEVLDMQLSISMSKIYDPQSNISMPITGSIFNTMFMLAFFLSNAHLVFIQLIITSFRVIPVGNVMIHSDMAVFAVEFFSAILVLALKLAIPLIAAQLLTEMSVGIIMKAIPQINVFVINIQLKFLLGLIVLIALIPSYSKFIDQIIGILMNNLQNSLQLFL